MCVLCAASDKTRDHCWSYVTCTIVQEKNNFFADDIIVYLTCFELPFHEPANWSQVSNIHSSSPDRTQHWLMSRSGGRRRIQGERRGKESVGDF